MSPEMTLLKFYSKYFVLLGFSQPDHEGIREEGMEFTHRNVGISRQQFVCVCNLSPW